MKIRPVGAELLRADRQTDRRTDRHDEATVAFAILRTSL
jgi:hypothetical protein